MNDVDKILPVKRYSKILDENFMIHADGKVVFDCGVEYTRDEMEDLKDVSHQERIEFHVLRRVFTEENPYVSENVKKMTALAIKASSKEAEIFPVEMHSETLDEDNTLYADGRIVFASGVEYTLDEWEKLSGLSEEGIRAVHAAKKVFLGSKIVERKSKV